MAATLTPISMYRGQPASAVGTLYTAPSAVGQYAIMKELVAVNTTSTDKTLTFFAVDQGGAAGVANCMLNELLVEAGTTQLFEFSTVLEEGDFLAASVSAVGITLTISGVEKT